MKKLSLFLMIVLSGGNTVFTQIENEPVWIDMADLQSSNIHITTSFERLINFIGFPEHFILNKEISHYGDSDSSKNRLLVYDTVNTLIYKKGAILYWEQKKHVWLHQLYFNHEDYYSIHHPKIIFDKYLHLSDFKKAFQLTSEEELIFLKKNKMPICESKKAYYTLAVLKISENNSFRGDLEVYFNK